MLSREPVSASFSLTSTSSLHYFDPLPCTKSGIATLNRSSVQTNQYRHTETLYRTASSSPLCRTPSTTNPSYTLVSPHRIPSKPSVELDACWRGTSDSFGRQNGAQSLCGDFESTWNLYEFLKEAQLDHYYSVFSKHLKIRSIQQIKYVTDAELDEMGMSKPEQRRFKKYFEKECPRTAMGKLKKKLTRTSMLRASSVGRSISCLLEEDEYAVNPSKATLSSPTNLGYRIIQSSELDVASALGQGEFGQVYQGFWRTESGRQLQVAVKFLDLDKFPTKTEDFLKEASLMFKLDHPDIVRLYGVCVAPKCLKLVTELAPLRSLLECLQEPSLRVNFPISILHSFAVQIARGMAYLEEERLVHRDLAARNILVFSKDKIKIGDFGLSQALQLGKSYYETNISANLRLPVAWCAPESIHELRFTSASDIWSYGVTLWEMFTYGFTPWAGLSGKQILEAVDTPNCKRLYQPDACPDAVFDAVMRACWNHEPQSRPNFAQLSEMLPHLSPQSLFVVNDHGNFNDNSSKPVEHILNILNSNAPIESTNETNLNPSSQKRLLNVSAKEMVYVLSKRDPDLWKVVSHKVGSVGFIPPANLRVGTFENASSNGVSCTSESIGMQKNSPAGTFSRMRLRLSRKEFPGRSRRSSTGLGGHLRSDMISLPQNDFRHIGHVGADGSMFGDLGLVSSALLETESSPTGSCLTIENNWDKENPRLSDITLREPNFENGVACKQSSRFTPSLSSPTENKSLADSNNINGTTNGFKSDFLGGEETSVFDMDSSFMDDVFKCFSSPQSESNEDFTSKSPLPPPPLSACLSNNEDPPSGCTLKSVKGHDYPTPNFHYNNHVDVVDNAIRKSMIKSSSPPSSAPLQKKDCNKLPSYDGTPKHSSHGFASNTLIRGLRKTSATRNSSFTRKSSSTMSSALSLDTQTDNAKEDRCPSEFRFRTAFPLRKTKTNQDRPPSSKPRTNGASIVISAPILIGSSTHEVGHSTQMDNHPFVVSDLSTESNGESGSHGSSLTIISSTVSSTTLPTLLPHNCGDGNTLHSGSDFPFQSRADRARQSIDKHIGSISSTPSVSPAPSLRSMASLTNAQHYSIAPARSGPPLPVGAHPIRAFRNRDAVFRASTNLPASRRRVFNSQALLPPTNEILKGRLSVSDAVAPNFVVQNRLKVNNHSNDSVSVEAISSPIRNRRLHPQVSSSRMATESARHSISPSSSSLDSGHSVPSLLTDTVPVDYNLVSDNHKKTPSPVTVSNGSISEEMLSFWGSDLAGFLSGDANCKELEANNSTRLDLPLLRPSVVAKLTHSNNDDYMAV